MKRTIVAGSVMVALTTAAVGAALTAQDRYAAKVPNGLAMSEFKGFENWPVIALSENNGLLAVIVGNPAMIGAAKAGAPGNGKSFPDGAKMAKIHWNPRKNEAAPGAPTVPGTLHDVDFMVKDSKRFADSGGWGYAEFEYDGATETFRPGTTTDSPPQANDAKCGFACHTIAKNRDYVFTDYGKR
ncbi:MAG: cytochrome P460 family protein [Proteobacteria bacterium]|nr:cytochrome P460 family protein [Pseudomonadota bacterium]